MMRRMLAPVLAATAIAFSMPGTAWAYATGSLEITGTSQATYSSDVAFRATVEHACPDPDPYGGSYCGFFAVVTKVPTGQSCTDTSTAWVGPIVSSAGTFTYAETFASYEPATGIACLYAHEGGSYFLLASAPYTVPGGAAGPPTIHPGNPKPPSVPPPAPTPAAPAAPAFDEGLSQEPIPRWIAGRRRYVRFSVSTAGVPSDVHVERFKSIVSRASRRWGLRAARVTSRRLRRYDRRNEVGFSWGIEDGVLGVQSDNYLVRTALLCVRRDAYGRCSRVRRKVVSRRLVDRDLAINARAPWQQGPDHPGPYEFDLESVLIHELGHLAGNDHSRPCRNTPMIPALAAGEWWRSPSDYNLESCGMASAATSSGARDFGHFKHIRRERELPVR